MTPVVALPAGIPGYCLLISVDDVPRVLAPDADTDTDDAEARYIAQEFRNALEEDAP